MEDYQDGPGAGGFGLLLIVTVCASALAFLASDMGLFDERRHVGVHTYASLNIGRPVPANKYPGGNLEGIAREPSAP